MWAATASMGMRSISLTPCATYASVPESTQQGVLLAQKAFHRIHDELLLPVMQALCQENGLSPPTSIRTLPLDIRMLILHCLPVRSPASQPHRISA